MAVERMLTEAEPAAELVGRVLHEAGIEYVFGISGGHTGRIVSGLAKYQNSVKMMMVREESLAGVMAEVYGRLTRRPGVLIGQGPWVLGNGLIGTMEAYLSSSPMLLLTDFSDATGVPFARAVSAGDRRLRQLGRAARVQRRHQAGDAGARTGRRRAGHATGDQARDGRPAWPGRGPVRAGFAQRQGRAGLASGAVSDQPLPAADAAARRYRRRRSGRGGVAGGEKAGGHRRQRRSDRAGVRRAARSGRGGGTAGLHDRRGQRHLRRDPPIWRLGVFGTFGTPAANACLAEADLVLAIGTKLGPSDTAWENKDLLDPTRQTFIQIDVEPKNASWNFPAEHVLIGDAAVVLRQMLRAVEPRATAAAARRPWRVSPPGARKKVTSTIRNICPTRRRCCRNA